MCLAPPKGEGVQAGKGGKPLSGGKVHAPQVVQACLGFQNHHFIGNGSSVFVSSQWGCDKGLQSLRDINTKWVKLCKGAY